MATELRTCLWFDGVGEEAARFYVELLPGSEIENVVRPQPDGPALVVDFKLLGAPYQALNGGKGARFNTSASISLRTEDQDETDRLWTALTADGGVEGRCGWLKDRFGLSWQIVPLTLTSLMLSSDQAASARVMQALMGMNKIEIAGLEAAHRGA